MTSPSGSDSVVELTFQRVVRFAQSVDSAAEGLFRGQDLYLELTNTTRQLVEDCRRFADSSVSPAEVIPIVGEVGVGKSWLAQCFLEPHPDNKLVRMELRSGQNSEDRTRRLTWFGPSRPFRSEDPNEQFIQLPASRMLDLGVEYIVGDTPGFTDANTLRQQLAHRAVTSSALKIFVTSIASLRDGRHTDLVGLMDGATILPVVKYDPVRQSKVSDGIKPTAEDKADAESALSMWRKRAPRSIFLEPCYMPDKDKVPDVADGLDQKDPESLAIDFVRRQLAAVLPGKLSDPMHNILAIANQIEGRMAAAENEISRSLNSLRQRLTTTINKKRRLPDRLQELLVNELVGDQRFLRAGLRQKLRAVWLDNTPEICFPYRTFCGILSLTAGGWDRLLMAFTGSFPSLAATFFQAAKNFKDSAEFAKSLSANLRDRIQRVLETDVKPDLQELNRALDNAVWSISESTPHESAQPWSLEISGIEQVEQTSHALFRSAIESSSARAFTAVTFAVLATTTFVALLSGPVAALYREYFVASSRGLKGQQGALENFPVPSFSMVITSLFLSAAPVFVIAMVGVWWSCRGKRLKKCLEDIKSSHETMTRDYVERGTLRVTPSDARLDAADFLLSIGQKDPQAEAS